MPKGYNTKGLSEKIKCYMQRYRFFLENGYEKTTTASIAKAQEWHHRLFLQL